jgi:hypothetical protein
MEEVQGIVDKRHQIALVSHGEWVVQDFVKDIIGQCSGGNRWCCANFAAFSW